MPRTLERRQNQSSSISSAHSTCHVLSNVHKLAAEPVCSGELIMLIACEKTWGNFSFVPVTIFFKGKFEFW